MPRIRSLFTAVLTVGLAASSWARRAQAATYVDDPLTSPSAAGRGSQGGSFGPNGFTTSAPSDSVWYEISEPLPTGRVEYTVTGLSLATSLIEADNDIFTIYQAPTGETEPIPYWPWRQNDFKVFTRIFGAGEIDRPGAMKLELAGCPRGEPWWHDELCPESCNSISGIAYANGNQNDVGWDANASYRMALAWGDGNMTFFRDGNALGTVGYPGVFAPLPMRVRIGTPRNDVPIGITVRDLLVTGTPGQQTEICQVGTVPEDAGVTPPPPACDPYIEPVWLSPVPGSGASTLFETRYRHCMGASAFRIVQLYVGDSVAPGVPSLHIAYEAGQFHLDGKSCSPGESAVLATGLGSVDCSLSSAGPSGNDLVVTWAVRFDTTAFAGLHGVFLDAKGPTSVDPEPRLGWTSMGTFLVQSETADAGAPPPRIDAGAGGSGGWGNTDAGGPSPGPTPKGAEEDSDGLIGGCGCKLALRDHPHRGISLAGWIALVSALFVRAARRR